MRLFLKKLFIAPLYAGAAFLGAYGFFLVFGPFNLPYLLKLPEESIYIFCIAFSLVFTSIVAVIVRTDRCRKEGTMPNAEKSLIWQVITFREFLTELAVFAVLAAMLTVWVGVGRQEPFWVILLATLLSVLVETLVFALVDGLLWLITFKRL